MKVYTRRQSKRTDDPYSAVIEPSGGRSSSGDCRESRESRIVERVDCINVIIYILLLSGIARVRAPVCAGGHDGHAVVVVLSLTPSPIT